MPNLEVTHIHVIPYDTNDCESIDLILVFKFESLVFVARIELINIVQYCTCLIQSCFINKLHLRLVQNLHNDGRSTFKNTHKWNF